MLSRVERGGENRVLGDQAADVDVIYALLPEDVNQRVTAQILSLECRICSGVPALVHHGLDDLLPDQV